MLEIMLSWLQQCLDIFGRQATVGYVGNMAWSADGAYLAVQNENMPHALFIWSAQTLELVSILLQVGGLQNN